MRRGVDAAQEMRGRDGLTQGQFVDAINRPSHIAQLRDGEHGCAPRHGPMGEGRQKARYGDEQRRTDHGPAKTKAPHQAPGGERAEQSADTAHRYNGSQQHGVELELANGKEYIQAASEAQEEGGSSRAE